MFGFRALEVLGFGFWGFGVSGLAGFLLRRFSSGLLG